MKYGVLREDGLQEQQRDKKKETNPCVISLFSMSRHSSGVFDLS